MNRTMGPVLAGTVIVQNIDLSIRAYVDWLGMQVAEQGSLPEVLAGAWNMPTLSGSRYVILVSESGSQWIRFIEDQSSEPAKPVGTLGWMALEVLVSDVYDLATRLKDSEFRFIGEAAPLDVSPSINACQVVGPAGEVLYLTSISEPVPPFELPMASCCVDKLFIPVLAVSSRAESMAFYEKLSGSKALAFETKVTVVNNSLGRDVQRKLPVCTVQLDGESLIEIDEVSEFATRAKSASGVVNGVMMVSFCVDSLDVVKEFAVGDSYVLDGGIYRGQEAQLFKSASGELIELVKRG